MKSKTIYICTQCGHESAKWYGQCPGCNNWNTFSEEAVTEKPKNRAAQAVGAGGTLGLTETPRHIDHVDTGTDAEIRFPSGIGELDRVLGGGIVSGSVVLVGGDPGIGKSTLLLQMCRLTNSPTDDVVGRGDPDAPSDTSGAEPSFGSSIFYISGEESERQVKCAQSVWVSRAVISMCWRRRMLVK